jgi:hypothetical protein
MCVCYSKFCSHDKDQVVRWKAVEKVNENITTPQRVEIEIQKPCPRSSLTSGAIPQSPSLSPTEQIDPNMQNNTLAFDIQQQQQQILMMMYLQQQQQQMMYAQQQQHLMMTPNQQQMYYAPQMIPQQQGVIYFPNSQQHS